MLIKSLDVDSPKTQLLLAVVGAGLAAASGWAFNRSERLLKRGKRARGVITRLDWGGDSARIPVFSFTVPDGSKYLVSSNTRSSSSTFSVGQEVPILYDPEYPSTTARIDTFGQIWGGAILFGAIGLGLLVYTLVHWLIHR